jgi:hypothetical protein
MTAPVRPTQVRWSLRFGFRRHETSQHRRSPPPLPRTAAPFMRCVRRVDLSRSARRRPARLQPAVERSDERFAGLVAPAANAPATPGAARASGRRRTQVSSSRAPSPLPLLIRPGHRPPRPAAVASRPPALTRPSRPPTPRFTSRHGRTRGPGGPRRGH